MDVGRRVVRMQRGHEDRAGTARMQRVDRGERVRHRFGFPAGEQLELELIGRDHVGRRQRALAHEFRNAGAHEHAAPDVADHRIAAIAHRRIGAPHLQHGVEDGLADIGRAHIAGEHAVAQPQRAALGNARDHLADHAGVEDAPFQEP